MLATQSPGWRALGNIRFTFKDVSTCFYAVFSNNSGDIAAITCLINPKQAISAIMPPYKKMMMQDEVGTMNTRERVIDIIQLLSFEEEIAQIEQKLSMEQQLKSQVGISGAHRNDGPLAKKLTMLKSDLDQTREMLLQTEPNKEKLKLLRSLLDGDDKEAFFPVEEKENKAIHPEVYQKLYPFLRLAHAYEKNGSVHEHAKKLSSVFKKKQDALKYLLNFSETFPEKKAVVHDACLFRLPEVSPHQQHWLALASREGGNNLLKKDFVLHMGLSSDIDRQVIEEKKIQKELLLQLKKKHNEEDEIELAISINKDIRSRKTFCKSYASGFVSGGRNEANRQLNKRYLLELDQLYSDRAIFHLNKSFNQYTIQDINDCYMRLLLSSPSKSLFSKLGIDQANYRRFSALDRSIAGKNIPDVLLDCGDGFYLKKLKVQDEKEASVAACLGKLTDCCQSLSGEAGDACAEHGLTSEDSGFYVLFKGDVSHPNVMDDPIYAQTWVSRTPSGMLLFDSIESKLAIESDAEAKKVVSAYRGLANHLIERDDVVRVQCGDSSGVSDLIGVEDVYGFDAEPPKNYWGYRDSYDQLLLADARLFLKLSDDDWVLDKNKCLREVEECERSQKLTDTMRYNIGWAVCNEQLHHVESLLSSDAMKACVNFNRKYFSQLKAYIEDDESKHEPKLDSNLLSNVDLNIAMDGKSFVLIAAERGHGGVLTAFAKAKADLNLQNKSGESPLVLALRNRHFHLAEMLIAANVNPNLPDHDGRTALIEAAKVGNVAMVDLLLGMKAHVNLQDKNGYSALMLAAHAGHLAVVKRLLDAKADLHEQNAEGNSALILAAINSHPAIVSKLIAAGANPDLCNHHGDTALMLVAGLGKMADLKVFSLLLKDKPKVNCQNEEGDSALMLAVKSNSIAFIDMLIHANVDVGLTNHEGLSALDLAVKLTINPAITALLKKATTKHPDGMNKISHKK